eukprot:1656483-Amphidinium_carterae.1
MGTSHQNFKRFRRFGLPESTEKVFALPGLLPWVVGFGSRLFGNVFLALQHKPWQFMTEVLLP